MPRRARTVWLAVPASVPRSPFARPIAMAITIGLGASVFTIYRALTGTALPLEAGDRIVAAPGLHQPTGAFRHQGHPGGPEGNDSLEGLGCGSAFHVEGNRQDLLQYAEVAILDVPAVAPQVDRDAVGSCTLGQEGRRHRLRLMAAPGLPEGGHMIDVHAKPEVQCGLQ